LLKKDKENRDGGLARDLSKPFYVFWPERGAQDINKVFAGGRSNDTPELIEVEEL